jgi:hypothetical protein
MSTAATPPLRAPRPWPAPAAAGAAAVALVATYLALGGASYKPLTPADPCKPRPTEQLRQREGTLQRLTLSALDGAACSLRVTREELTLALAGPAARARFVQEHHISDAEFAAAVRGALLRSIDDAERTGDLSPVIAPVLRAAAQRLPVAGVIAVLERASGRSAPELLSDLLERLGSQGG